MNELKMYRHPIFHHLLSNCLNSLISNFTINPQTLKPRVTLGESFNILKCKAQKI